MRRKPGQANVEEHPKGSGRWRVRARIDGRLITVASGIGRGAAEETAAAYTQLRNEDVVREGLTLTQFGGGFLLRRELGGVRGIREERNRWGAYVERHAIGSLPVATLRRRDVLDWLDWLAAKKLAAQTRRNALNLLRSALQEAVDRELLEANPARDVRISRRANATTRDELEGILTPDEQQALLDAVPARDMPAVLFALTTGLRESEQWRLQWDDVREDCVIVRYSKGGKAPKSGKPREVPLLAPALRAIEMQPRRARWPFPAPRGGRRKDSTPPRGWHQWVKAAGISRRIRWQDLRHTCATSLLAGWWGRKWSLDEVCQMLGHSTTKVTERYARKLRETLRLAAARTEFPASSPLLTTRGAQVIELKPEARTGFEPAYDGFAKRPQSAGSREDRLARVPIREHQDVDAFGRRVAVLEGLDDCPLIVDLAEGW